MRIAQRLNTASVALGKFASWQSLILTLLVLGIVIARYGFNLGSIAIQELAVFLHSGLFILCAGFALTRDAHVRVDIFYRKLSVRGQHRVNLFGTLLLLLPSCVAIFVLSLEYVQRSWILQETSSDSAVPFYLLKTLLLILPLLLAAAGIGQALEAIQQLRAPEHREDSRG